MDKFEYISSEIRKFNPKITIDGSFGNADFAMLLEKYPKVMVYIKSFSMASAGGLGFFGGSKKILMFEYKNQDIDYSSIYVCNDVKSMENYLVYNLKNFNSRIVYIVPNNSLVEQLVNNIQNGPIGIQHPFFKGLGTLDGGAFNRSGPYFFAMQIHYHVDPKDLKEMDRQVDLEVTRVANMLFEPTMPKEVKVLLAHNYLAYIATYDPSYLNKSVSFNPYSHSAYGALITKRCVCHGFSEAFKRILNRGGVTCEIICGQVNGTSVGHAWNIVKIEEDYYHVDVTFDDQADIIFKYFMKNDREMRMDRVWNESYYPKCNGSKNIMLTAKTYINMNKSKLILKGIKMPMLKTL